MRRLLAARRTAPNSTGWAGQRVPRGEERHHALVRPDPHRGSPGPYIHTGPEPRVGPNPGRVPDQEGPWGMQGSGADTCVGLALQSPRRRRPAACGPWYKLSGQTWPEVVRPLHLLRKIRAACHCADRRRAPSTFNATRPIRWQAASRSSSGQRACWVCWWTVHLCWAAHCTHLIFRKKPPRYARDSQISGREDCLDNRY
jgi:hypothetical protein